VNLAAMRELANSAARSAIQTHAKHRGGKLAVGKFAGFGVCGAIGFVLLAFALYQRSWWIGLQGLLGLAIAGYWALQGAGHALHVLKLGKPSDDDAGEAPAAEPAAADEAPAADQPA
jgi:hypothetical protein